jgi:hypothetical protein
MDRWSKEQKRKHAEARAGLNKIQIEELDAKDAAENALKEEARNLHAALFPEESVFFLDSISDANDRRRGINPMSSSYIAKTNARRAELGFAPFMDDASDLPTDTLGWVLSMLLEGKREELHKIKLKRRLINKAGRAAFFPQGEISREALGKKIDSILASNSFLKGGRQSTNAPSGIAYRLYGCWFKCEGGGYQGTAEEFVIQLQRLCPGLPAEEYAVLRQEALNKWIVSVR